jgi:hypothetical protein
MRKNGSPWLDPTPPPDVRLLDVDELRAFWRTNRNSLGAAMAAEELMRRLDAKILTVEPYPQPMRTTK